ncbi:class I SAM-dependent methyltransferase [Prosthecobacter sp. SYSU 5D2]|uniref:class I SAM-dependent methyltransferase n=1 Tax=Prosthecobacter sp. SYSU 5D2 TaxID=3134134 RepID=UPI0031FF1D7B
MENLHCRSCNSPGLLPVIDLGSQPLANNLLNPEDLGKPEPRFPLKVNVCTSCWLMQISDTVPPVDLFSDYVYFSSFSDHMLQHAREASLRYISEKSLSSGSFVVEVASNDGYLLRNFVEAGVPCLGFEPAANIAKVARENGVETHCSFFGLESASALSADRGRADLILGNNVFAHVPAPNDFVAGLKELLKPAGWIVLEFPYGVDMIDKVEFDTIYHEHVFYFTLTPLLPLFARHGLEIFHVERLAIHGGSLRLFACHHGQEQIRPSVSSLLKEEAGHGVGTTGYYQEFSNRAAKVKAELTAFLEEQQAAGKRVAAYGASAKGSTLLNYVGEAARTIEFIADRSTYKHGKLSPGVHAPILPAEELAAKFPDYALLLAWNFATEIVSQQSVYITQGGKFAVPLPKLKLIP